MFKLSRVDCIFSPWMPSSDPVHIGLAITSGFELDCAACITRRNYLYTNTQVRTGILSIRQNFRVQ